MWSLRSPTTDWICPCLPPPPHSPALEGEVLTIGSPMKFLKHIFTGFSFLDFRSLWSWLSSVSPQGELDTLYLVSIRHWFLSSLSTPTFSYPPKANKQGIVRLLETIGPEVSGRDLWLTPDSCLEYFSPLLLLLPVEQAWSHFCLWQNWTFGKTKFEFLFLSAIVHNKIKICL